MAVLEPVCGCDGMTYGNDCEAATTSAGIDYEGECADDLERGAMWRSATVSFGECIGSCELLLRAGVFPINTELVISVWQRP